MSACIQKGRRTVCRPADDPSSGKAKPATKGAGEGGWVLARTAIGEDGSIVGVTDIAVALSAGSEVLWGPSHSMHEVIRAYKAYLSLPIAVRRYADAETVAAVAREGARA